MDAMLNATTGDSQVCIPQPVAGPSCGMAVLPAAFRRFASRAKLFALARNQYSVYWSLPLRVWRDAASPF
jgi:hypothetical protein